MQYDTGKHCVFYHRYHLVWSTKYRYKVLLGDVRSMSAPSRLPDLDAENGEGPDRVKLLTIWGGLKSNNVQKVVWTADELGLEYALIPTGMEHGLTGTTEYRAINPNGLVPAIDDGGFKLWESNAIVRYLGAKYGGPHFYPINLQERARADRWMDWANLQFYSAMGPAFHQLVRAEKNKRNLREIEGSLAKAETYAGILDQHLADKEFANGEHFSMADICLGVIAHRWLGMPAKKVSRPHLERWFRSVRDRKSAKNVLVLPLR